MIAPSMLIVLSKRIGDPDAGLILTAPEDVLMVTASLPGSISFAKIDYAYIPVRAEPSPVTAVAATVPATVTVPLESVKRSVSVV